jgi:hypothetical protein
LSRVIRRANLVVRSGLSLYKELALSAATLLPRRRQAAVRLDTRAPAVSA